MVCFQAVECRHEGCVALLLQDKVELDSVDKDGNTSLHIAACDGSAKIAKMLCQAGASLTIKNRVWAVAKRVHRNIVTMVMSWIILSCYSTCESLLLLLMMTIKGINLKNASTFLSAKSNLFYLIKV